MTTDPFEHFGEQMYSHELIEQHRDLLVRDALEVLAEHPRAEPVGLIVDAQAREGDVFRRLLEQQVRGPIAGFVGILPRAMIRTAAAEAADFLEACSADERPTLPIVAITKNGYRFAAVALEARNGDA